MKASQTWPSWHSPSPRMVKTLVSFPRCLAPRAMPTAMEAPWPREPVEASTPGIFFMSGWPWSIPWTCRKVVNSSLPKKPSSESTP